MLLQIRPDLLALRISPVDATIVVVYLVILTGIGFWIVRGNGTVSDYLIVDRSLPWRAVLGWIVATETGPAAFLSVPGAGYAEG